MSDYKGFEIEVSCIDGEWIWHVYEGGDLVDQTSEYEPGEQTKPDAIAQAKQAIDVWI